MGDEIAEAAGKLKRLEKDLQSAELVSNNQQDITKARQAILAEVDNVNKKGLAEKVYKAVEQADKKDRSAPAPV